MYRVKMWVVSQGCAFCCCSYTVSSNQASSGMFIWIANHRSNYSRGTAWEWTYSVHSRVHSTEIHWKMRTDTFGACTKQTLLQISISDRWCWPESIETSAAEMGTATKMNSLCVSEPLVPNFCLVFLPHLSVRNLINVLTCQHQKCFHMLQMIKKQVDTIKQSLIT